MKQYEILVQNCVQTFYTGIPETFQNLEHGHRVDYKNVHEEGTMWNMTQDYFGEIRNRRFGIFYDCLDTLKLFVKFCLMTMQLDT